MTRLPGLDALRGWAILLVIAVHTSHWVSPASPSLLATVTYGFTGVTLFFVVSTFSLLFAHDRHRERGDLSMAAFFHRRAFRILPMLWVAMAYYLWRSGMGPRDWAPQGITLTDVLLVGTAMNGWHPLKINAVIPVGWSVAVEWSFYLIFPLLAFLVTNFWRAVAVTAAAAFLRHSWGVAAMPLYVDMNGDRHLIDLVSTFVGHMSLPPQMQAFMMGFVVFFAWRDGYLPTWRIAPMIWLILFVVFFVMAATGYGAPYPYETTHHALMMGCLVLAILTGRFSLLDNPVIRWIGIRSYSAYLLHMAVIYKLSSTPQIVKTLPAKGDLSWFVAFALVVAVTMAVSALTFAAVERPFMSIGSRLRYRQTSHP